jgi:cytochrome c biogenesis factor
MNVAHTGIVLFILGILLSNTFKLELTEQLHYGPLGIRLGSQVCCLRGIDHSFAPTYHSICANLLVYQQVNIENPRSLQHKPFAHNVNLQLERELVQFIRSGRFGSLRASFLSLSKVIRNGPYDPKQTYNRYSDPISASRRLDGQFMVRSICMFPEKRFYYSNQGTIATKVAIHSNLFTDFYSLIGTGSFETGWFTTIMKLPFIFCIWLGFMFGVFGGALAVKKQLKKSKIFWL